MSDKKNLSDWTVCCRKSSRQKCLTTKRVQTNIYDNKKTTKNMWHECLTTKLFRQNFSTARIHRVKMSVNKMSSKNNAWWQKLIKQKCLMTNIHQTKMSNDVNFSDKNFPRFIVFYSDILCFQEPFESLLFKLLR